MYSGSGEWTSELRLRSTVAAVENRNEYVSGSLSDVDFNCGWVGGFVRSSLERTTTSDCEPGNATFEFGEFQAAPFGGSRGGRPARGNNCYREDGSYIKIGGTACIMERQSALPGRP